MKLIYAAGLSAWVAWEIAKAVGLPIWHNWQTDRVDLTAAVFIAVLILGGRQ